MTIHIQIQSLHSILSIRGLKPFFYHLFQHDSCRQQMTKIITKLLSFPRYYVLKIYVSTIFRIFSFLDFQTCFVLIFSLYKFEQLYTSLLFAVSQCCGLVILYFTSVSIFELCKLVLQIVQCGTKRFYIQYQIVRVGCKQRIMFIIEMCVTFQVCCLTESVIYDIFLLFCSIISRCFRQFR